jgi:flagellar biosynthetic protein FlhB
MSSDADKESKTEMPTQKRLGETYDEGNFPKAQEIGVVFILIASFAYLSFQGQALAAQVGSFASWIFRHLHEYELTTTSIGYIVPELLKVGIFMVLPFLIVCLVAAIVGGGLQTGFRLTPNVLTLKFDRLNILNGIKNLFEVKQKLVMFAVSFLKFIVIAWVVYGVLMEIQKDEIFHSKVTPEYVALFFFKTFMIIPSFIIICKFSSPFSLTPRISDSN